MKLSCEAVQRSAFSEQLRAAAADVWEAQHAHPFVRGIGDGTLPVERFAHYVRQDYVFLIEYARMLALGAARATDLETMRRFADIAQAILGEEMELHRAFAREFGISEAELEAEPPAQATQAYTDFLVRTAALGDLGELAAALLPCMWGYSDLGIHLFNQGLPDEERYARWITAYASQEFADLTKWTCDLLDRLSEGAPEAAQRRIEHAFITSARYELAFWEMAWAGEKWPEEK